MQWLVLIVYVLTLLLLVIRVRLSLMSWTAGIAASLTLLPMLDLIGSGLTLTLWIIFLIYFIPLHANDLRIRWITEPLFNHMKKSLPPMSESEKIAIEAGNVWWDGELFSGNPNWKKLLNIPTLKLSDEEQAFIDGPTHDLCQMINDWEITHKYNDLPPEVWDFIKKQGFFGMIIPKIYGGLEFSAYAHSQVIQKISSRSLSAAVTVMVPNSLGPAELLMSYGTKEQNNYYLPRLATGEEIPCFALTGPFAGSDAGSMPDTGMVCEEEFDGEKTLGFRINWEKRYITLGPVSTVLGLAFHAYDPDQLLGDNQDLGITCALIPSDTQGVSIGRRHQPLNAAFMNGPNEGKDVFVPMDWIIGGQSEIGNGWRMLVERLAVGRGISLPSLSVGAGKLVTQTTGAYARVRKQFRTPIGKFEGVEEAMARIGGLTYMMDSARTLTLSALDSGEKPSVVTAIVKYYLTEGMRQVVNDGMDIHGGRGICMGPSNYLARMYQTIPVGITVEGANILTRSMIIFGQGAMRCHPFVLKEIELLSSEADNVLKDFDDLLLQHIAHFVRNAARVFLGSISGGWLMPSPITGSTATYYRQLTRFSAGFACMTDTALLVLGGALKRKEKLSGRFADALGHMYLCSAVLKRFEDDGRPDEDLPFVHWSCQHNLYQVQQALDGIIRHFPIRPIAWKLRVWLFPFGKRMHPPSDQLGHQISTQMMLPSQTRDKLVAGIYMSNNPDDLTGCLEHALTLTLKSEPIERRLRKKGIHSSITEENIKKLVDQDEISQDEAELLIAMQQAVRTAIMVDDFPNEEKHPS
ncbi:MAG: acyl-CoA dehydrogenase [Mariprofundaceae bacterium]